MPYFITGAKCCRTLLLLLTVSSCLRFHHHFCCKRMTRASLDLFSVAITSVVYSTCVQYFFLGSRLSMKPRPVCKGWIPGVHHHQFWICRDDNVQLSLSPSPPSFSLPKMFIEPRRRLASPMMRTGKAFGLSHMRLRLPTSVDLNIR